jgi:hypothetical protein
MDDYYGDIRTELLTVTGETQATKFHSDTLLLKIGSFFHKMKDLDYTEIDFYVISFELCMSGCISVAQTRIVYTYGRLHHKCSNCSLKVTATLQL